MVKFCEFLGKTITVCVLLGCADGTVGGTSWKTPSWEARKGRVSLMSVKQEDACGQEQVCAFEEGRHKNTFPMPEIETGLLGCPARSLVTIQTAP